MLTLGELRQYTQNLPDHTPLLVDFNGLYQVDIELERLTPQQRVEQKDYWLQAGVQNYDKTLYLVVKEQIKP